MASSITAASVLDGDVVDAATTAVTTAAAAFSTSASTKSPLVQFLELILTPSTPVFVIGFLIITLVPVVMHWYLTRTTAYITLPSILLAGPSGAGKTALVTLLERRADPAKEGPQPTHTTQVSHAVELAVGEDGVPQNYRDDLDAAGATARKFLLVDTPGHGKLRHAAAVDRLRSQAATKTANLKAVVFVVDAGALADPEGLVEAAAYLYDVLLALQKRMSVPTSKAPYAIPVLIAANKADLFTALPAPLVRAHLEAELGRIRQSRSRGLLTTTDEDDMAAAANNSIDDSPENAAWLGQYGSDVFSFGQMREFDIEVDVIGGNVSGDGPGVDKWWDWIAKQV